MSLFGKIVLLKLNGEARVVQKSLGKSKRLCGGFIEIKRWVISNLTNWLNGILCDLVVVELIGSKWHNQKWGEWVPLGMVIM